MTNRNLAPCQATVSIEDGEPIATQVQQHIDRLSDEDLKQATLDLESHLNVVATTLSLHVQELDRRGVTDVDEGLSTTSWLRRHTSMTVAEASGTVKTARAMSHMPTVAEKALAGDVPYRSVRLLAQVRDKHRDEFAGHETVFADVASYLSVRDLGRAVDHWVQQINYPDAVAAVRKREQLRGVYHHQTVDGLWETKGTFTPEGGHVVKAAIDGICDPQSLDPGEVRSPAQRRADAVVDICSFWLGHNTSAVTSGGEKPHVTVTVDYQVLAGHVERLPEIDGTPMAPEVMRRITCDAGIVPMVLGSDSEPLDVGRKTRTIPTGLRRAIEQRDKHCTWPGCYAPASWCDVHHDVHWADGGSTSLTNCRLLCRTHHTAQHKLDQTDVARPQRRTIPTPTDNRSPP